VAGGKVRTFNDFIAVAEYSKFLSFTNDSSSFSDTMSCAAACSPALGLASGVPVPAKVALRLELTAKIYAHFATIQLTRNIERAVSDIAAAAAACHLRCCTDWRIGQICEKERGFLCARIY